MKKTIQKPDGTTEVVEGTPEEIAEYERKLRGDVQEAPKQKGPGLLTEEVLKLLQGVQRFESPSFLPIPQHTPECEITVASRGWWCVNPPRCTCGLFVYPSYPFRYTYTFDTIRIGDVIPEPYIVTCNATGP